VTETTISPEEAQRRNRIVWLSILGFWLFYFAITTFRAWAYDSDDQLDMLARRVPVSLIGVVLTFGFWQVLRRFENAPSRKLLTVAFVLSFPVALAYAATNYAAFHSFDPHPKKTTVITIEEPVIVFDGDGAPIPPPPPTVKSRSKEDYPAWFNILIAATEWYFFIATWAVLFVALNYAFKVRHAERQAATYRAAAQTAELKALRYQVNPHFLFNTLNSLSSLVLGKRNAEAEAMILNLSTFFRTSLTAEPTEDVRLADEIELQRLYLDIERARFPERLDVVIDLPDALAEARVPGMLLQPLVENAIKYGVARSTRTVRVAIGAWAEAGALHLVVEDDGDAMGPAEGGNGIGLKNVCDRLHARFGDAGRCHIGRRPGGGYRVELVMPLLGPA
jgi:hypothetical protein